MNILLIVLVVTMLIMVSGLTLFLAFGTGVGFYMAFIDKEWKMLFPATLMLIFSFFSGWIAADTIKKVSFIRNHDTVYEDVAIKVIERTPTNVVYYIDNELYKRSDIKWLDTNNIKRCVNFYKDKTNTFITVKEN